MAGRTPGRIVTTQNVPKNIKLAKDIYAKHLADGQDSFLHQLEGDKWEAVAPFIDQAEMLDKEAQDLKRLADEKFESRDKVMKIIVNQNNMSKRLLKGKYAKTPKKLGDWGIEVDDTPKASRAKKKEQ